MADIHISVYALYLQYPRYEFYLKHLKREEYTGVHTASWLIPPPPPIHFRPNLLTFHKPSGTPEATKAREPKILISWESIHTDSPGTACLALSLLSPPYKSS